MRLFSLFKKSGTPDSLDAPDSQAGDDAARLAANSEAERLNQQALLAQQALQAQQARQRDIARATAMKIDAIESAMTFDIFNEPEPAWGSRNTRAAKPRPQAAAATNSNGPDTLALAELDTTLLLRDDDLPDIAVAAETAPIVEEIAILYANGQASVAEQMLVASLKESGSQDRTAWWMLFDLYQVSGQQDAFDHLSIDYASTFETSPPPWNAPALLAAASPGWAGVTPTAAFVGALDSHIAPQLEKLMQQAADSPVLRLEFSRVSSVEAQGCALLLQTLQTLEAQQRELILVAAPELAEQLRAMIAVGRRDDSQACWLLLLEVLQLLNREKSFEQTAMDYCITYEVSPPSFNAPYKVVSAPQQHAAASPDRFMLPPVIEHQLGALLPSITQYAEQYQTLVFDCSRLTRIDYAAANQWHGCLQALVKQGKKIELRDINHLVTALLRLLGYAEMAKMYPHKY